MPLSRIPPPPASVDTNLRAWCYAVMDALNAMPELSVISTSAGPNSSGHTGGLGAIAVDVGPSAVTRLWQKHSTSTSTTGWSAISRI